MSKDQAEAWNRAYSSSSWTGRAPRSMSDAFNPYTNNELLPMPKKQTTTERALGVILATVIGLLLAAAILHWAML